MTGVYVTYGWCRTAYTVVRSLGRRGFDVHVGDASGLAMSRWSRYCASFSQLPDFRAAPDQYVDAVVRHAAATGSSVIFPCHDDVGVIAERIGSLPPDLRLAIPSADSWRTAEDQLLCARAARALGCGVPATVELAKPDDARDAVAELGYPLVVKRRLSNSAKGVAIVRDDAALRSAVRDLGSMVPDESLVLQEYVEGRKFGHIAVYEEGRRVCSLTFEILRSKGHRNFGTSTLRSVASSPELDRQAERLMTSLRWSGVVDMDWIVSDEGTPYLIDVNARLGGATALTDFADVDVPYAWYLAACGMARRRYCERAPRPAVARWLLGDLIGAVDAVSGGDVQSALTTALPARGRRHDDFFARDPAPFIGECVDYGVKFLRSGGSLNPS